MLRTAFLPHGWTLRVVDPALALRAGPESVGKVALCGPCFETGRAEVKPGSKPQLDEMAEQLQSQPGLKVCVVGHTDNQGTLDGNVQLSQQRGAAVASALVSGDKVDPKRLVARGSEATGTRIWSLHIRR